MSSPIVDLEVIPFNDLWLQDLIWKLLDPVDYFQAYGYNKVSMMKHLETLSTNGNIWFLGSKSCGFVYRIFQPNGLVIEPHLLGNVSRIRSIQPLATEWVFTNTEVQKINVYTPYHSIMRICSRTGYLLEGVLRDTYFDQGKLKDIYILGLTKGDYKG